MRKRIVVRRLLIALALLIPLSIGLVLAGGMLRPHLQELLAFQVGASAPSPDLASLLAYPYPVQIEDLTGTERDLVVTKYMGRPEAVLLKHALSMKGFLPDISRAEAMRATVDVPGDTRTVDMVVVPMVAGAERLFLPLTLKNYSGSTSSPAPAGPSGDASALPPEGVVAYLVAMEADDGTSFYQAHHTNLDPSLAEVPDPAIIVNNMPYFYITTLQVVDGRIVYWRYWWYDSHRHPNWYYSCYQHYWDYYYHGGYPWPAWYDWTYGWYYWRFWYFWSTWFPW